MRDTPVIMRLRELFVFTGSVLVTAACTVAGCTTTVIENHYPADAPSHVDARGNDTPTSDASDGNDGTTSGSNDGALDARADVDAALGCPGYAPSKAALDLNPGWKAPPAVQTVCTTSDVTAFESNFKGATVYADLVKGLPAACASCILGPQTDPTWGFIVTQGTGGFFNYGACYARATNGSDACGKAVQYRELCIDMSCAGCMSVPENSACQSDTATQTACSTGFQADIQTGCGTNTATLAALDNACGKATSAVKVLCGG